MNEKRKVRIPDGKGGWTYAETTEEAKKVEYPKEKAQENLQKEQEKDFFSRVGACTDALNNFLKFYVNDNGLSAEEIMAAIYLENLNNREFYPGGTEKYDNVCKDVYNWFQANKA
jgi:hypothetical protein